MIDAKLLARESMLTVPDARAMHLQQDCARSNAAANATASRRSNQAGYGCEPWEGCAAFGVRVGAFARAFEASGRACR